MYWRKDKYGNGGWCVQINFQGRKIYLGSFQDLNEAEAAYNHAALKYHGKFANF